MASSVFRLSTLLRNGHTRVGDLYFEAPFKFMTPIVNGQHSDFIVMLASPGFLKGDEAHISIDFGSGSDSTITTQSYEKVLNTAEGSAQRTINLRVHGDAKAVFTPFPVILFRNSAFTNTTTAHIAAESTFIYGDVVSCGRVGMNERWAMRRFTNRLRVYVAEPEAVTMARNAGAAEDEPAAAMHQQQQIPKTGQAQPREHLSFADRMLLEPDAFDYTNLGMWREFTHCGVVYIHLPENLPEQEPADVPLAQNQVNTGTDPDQIRSRIQTSRLKAEDALVDRIRGHADAIGFKGELGVSRVIDGVCVRLLTTRADDAFDFVKDITNIVTKR